MVEGASPEPDRTGTSEPVEQGGGGRHGIIFAFISLLRQVASPVAIGG
jgi:hypothetical protein